MRILPAFLALASFVATASAQTITVSKENRTIAITTSDDASALADVAVVTIGFNLYGTDQQQTYADATRTSNAIMKALTDAGIKAEAIQSASQSLSPIDENDKLHYAKGLRFEFNQSWRVTTAAKSASDVLHIAITAGANNSGGIQWQLADDNALEAEAAQKALTHARQIADRMAKGLNAKLGALVYASNQTPPRNFFGGMMLNTESASISPAPPNLKPLAISPEKIQKSATVYAVFAIE
jgi:uncharacterized protein